jgi:uncharacterized protein YcbX
MSIGSVSEIWRYAVKSMGGELLERVRLEAGGIPGDRGWAVRDEEKGGIRGAKKIPGLMQCRARYLAPPTVERAGPAEITLPDGSAFASDDPQAATRLSAFLAKRVTLWPLQPADKLDHYRRGAPDHEDLEVELRSMFGLEEDEPLPDLSVFPPEIMEYESPLGTYFDAFPLLVMTDASLERLGELLPESVIDVRRFRPNFLIRSEQRGFAEAAWPGKKLRLGRAVIEIIADCPRCVMTTHAFGDIPKDPQIMRTLVRENSQMLGVYARVVEPGEISVDDSVDISD